MVTIAAVMTSKQQMADTAIYSRNWRWSATAGVIVALLVGCADRGVRSGDGLGQKEGVTRNAQSRWAAVIAGDWDRAYSFVSSASRSVVSLEVYRKRVGMVSWLKADVTGVECSAADLCTVTVRATYAYTARVAGRVENEQILTETWRNTEGGWVYLLPDLL